MIRAIQDPPDAEWSDWTRPVWIALDAWDEGSHERAENGQFGRGAAISKVKKLHALAARPGTPGEGKAAKHVAAGIIKKHNLQPHEYGGKPEQPKSSTSSSSSSSNSSAPAAQEHRKKAEEHAKASKEHEAKNEDKAASAHKKAEMAHRNAYAAHTTGARNTAEHSDFADSASQTAAEYSDDAIKMRSKKK
jgi:hypothetical protein